jgi:hypothetical protein
LFAPLQDPTPLAVHLEAAQQTEDNTLVDGGDRYDDSHPLGVALKNAADEVDPPTDNDDDSVAGNETRTRSGRVSRPLDKENKYPGIYCTNGKIPEGRCLEPYYMDENYEPHGDYYSNQYFTENVTETTCNTSESPDKINLIKVKEEQQHYLNAIKWMDVKPDDVTAMMFAAKQMSIQDGMKNLRMKAKLLR